MISRFTGAVQFLTILPARGRTAELGQCAIFFPLVGAGIGVCSAALMGLLEIWFPVPIASALALAFVVFLTGALHEDAVADVADAFRGWRTPERIHAILKDSRVGAHGAAALIVILLIRWQAFQSLVTNPIPSFGAAFALGRAAMVALVWITPPAGDGAGMHFSQTMSSWTAAAACLIGSAFAFWPGFRAGLTLLAVAVLLTGAVRRQSVGLIGGVTGDCAGATGYVVETSALVLLTCRPCSW